MYQRAIPTDTSVFCLLGDGRKNARRLALAKFCEKLTHIARKNVKNYP